MGFFVVLFLFFEVMGRFVCFFEDFVCFLGLLEVFLLYVG